MIGGVVIVRHKHGSRYNVIGNQNSETRFASVLQLNINLEQILEVLTITQNFVRQESNLYRRSINIVAGQLTIQPN
jgi:hypothetical protein